MFVFIDTSLIRQRLLFSAGTVSRRRHILNWSSRNSALSSANIRRAWPAVLPEPQVELFRSELELMLPKTLGLNEPVPSCFCAVATACLEVGGSGVKYCGAFSAGLKVELKIFGAGGGPSSESTPWGELEVSAEPSKRLPVKLVELVKRVELVELSAEASLNLVWLSQLIDIPWRPTQLSTSKG